MVCDGVVWWAREKARGIKRPIQHNETKTHIYTKRTCLISASFPRSSISCRTRYRLNSSLAFSTLLLASACTLAESQGDRHGGKAASDPGGMGGRPGGVRKAAAAVSELFIWLVER
jgi:hypothetical protein